jgi:hypothetical protein
VLDVVEELADDVVGGADELVVVARCVVVVFDRRDGEVLEQAARIKPAPAITASARRRGLTPRSPPAGPNRGTV